MIFRWTVPSHYIYVSLILAAALALPTFLSLTTEVGAPQEFVASNAPAIPNRSPSSIAPLMSENILPEKKSNPTLKIDLNCKTTEPTRLKISQDQVQLYGKNCGNSLKSQEVRITNRTNGFNATYFDKGAGLYQTDLIQLNDGENEIEIHFLDSSGKPTESLVKVFTTNI